MPGSKKRNLPQFAITAAIALQLQACSPQQGNVGRVSDESGALVSARGESATFVVDPISSSGADHQIIDPTWNVMRRHLVTLRACLRDIGKLQPVVSQTFAVKGGETDRVLNTDANGCLTWNESLEFNYLARESFVQTQRVIEPRGFHRGARTVPIAIDPWRTDASSVIDLRYGVASDATAHDLRKTAARLLVENASVSFSDQHSDGDATAIALQLSAQPQILRAGLSDRLQKEALRTASFRIDLAIIEKLPGQGSNGSDLRTTVGSGTFESSLNRGNVQIQDQIRLNRIPRKDAVLEVALRFTPIDAPADLEPFEGLMLLPALSGPANSSIKALSVPFDDYADSQRPKIAALAKTPATCSDGSDSFGFYFTSWSVTPNGVARVTPNEGVPSSLSVTLSACLASPIDQKPLAGHSFSASFNAPVERIADGKGCISWQDAVDFNYYGAERWIDRKITVRGTNAPIAGIEKSIAVPVNPWRADSRFAWDCRAGRPPALSGAKQAQIELQNFGYTFTGQDYKLDRGLNLSVVRHYLLRLEPKIRRHDAQNRVATYESAREGRFKLRAVVVSPSNDVTSIGASTQNVLSGAKLLAASEIEVQAVNGVIQQDLPLAFDFKALPLLNSRNLIFIEVSPLGGTPLRKAVAQASFVPTADQGQVGLMTSPQGAKEISDVLASSAIDIESLARSGASVRKNLKEQTFAQFMTEFRAALNLRAIEESSARAAGLTPDEIGILVSGSGSASSRGKALSKLCALASKDPAGCTRLSSPQWSVTPVRHIESLLGGQEIRSVDTGSILVNAGLSQDVSASESDSEGTTVATTVSAGARISLRLGSFENPVGGGLDAGINHGKTWFTTHTTSQNSGRSSSASLVFGKTLLTDEVELSFDAQVRECAVIRLNATALTGFHLCAAQPVRKRMTESWYYIGQFGGSESSPLRDGRLAVSQPYSKVIRGKVAFARFKNALESSTNVIVLKRDTAFSDQQARMTDAQKRFAATTPEYSDGAFPAAVVLP